MTSGITFKIFNLIHAMTNDYHDLLITILMKRKWNITYLQYKSHRRMAVAAGMRFPKMLMISIAQNAIAQRHIGFVRQVIRMRPDVNIKHHLTLSAVIGGRVDLFTEFVKMAPTDNKMLANAAAYATHNGQIAIWQYIIDQYKPKINQQNVWRICKSPEMFAYLRGVFRTNPDDIMRSFVGKIEAAAFMNAVKLNPSKSLIDQVVSNMEHATMVAIIRAGYQFDRPHMIAELNRAVAFNDLVTVRACQRYVTTDTFKILLSSCHCEKTHPAMMTAICLPSAFQQYFDMSIAADKLEFAKYFHSTRIGVHAAIRNAVNRPKPHVPIINWLKTVSLCRDWPNAIIATTSSLMVGDIVFWVGRRELSTLELLPAARARINEWLATFQVWNK